MKAWTRAHRLRAAAPAIESISELAAIRRRPANIAPLAVAFSALYESLMTAEDPAPASAQLAALDGIAQTMIDFRSQKPLDLRGDLRVIAMKLERQYDEAEQSLLTDLDRLIADPGAMADPAFNSAYNRHRQYFEDLQRVRRLPEWTRAIESLRPQFAARFAAQARKMAEWLIDPGRRPEAVRAMEQFDLQWSMFESMPLEEEVRARDGDVEALLGGQGAALATWLDEQRGRWAEAWAAGDGASEAAGRLALASRLLTLARDLRGLRRAGPDAAQLNRWAAWEMHPPAIAPAIIGPPNRLVLAVQSLLGGDFEDAGEQLDRIAEEAALARLIGRIAWTIGDALAALPGGAPGGLGQAALPPHTGRAWLIAKRSDLAELCRYRTEAWHARATRRESLASECDRYVDHLTARILRSIAPDQITLPTLIGFDGRDPSPGGE